VGLKKPKILFINSQEFDYLQDLTYSGLARILNPENIIEYPWNRYYHLNIRQYPKNLGFTDKTLFKSLKAKLKKRIYDFVFVASAKPETFRNYLGLIESISQSIPVIFIDGGDFTEIGGDLKRLNAFELFTKALSYRKFDTIFKREYLLNEKFDENVHPLQFSFNYDRMLEDLPYNLKYQVTFWAVESNPIRTKVFELLYGKFDCNENGTYRNQVFKKYARKGNNYLRELSNCKIILNFPGVGWDTQRYWEVPALGRFMISYKPQIKIPDNFIDAEQIIFCKDDLSDLIEKCEYYLINETAREKIASAGLQHFKKYHSNISRAKYILNKIGIDT
jgi:spore maturation protein CgeB